MVLFGPTAARAKCNNLIHTPVFFSVGTIKHLQGLQRRGRMLRRLFHFSPCLSAGGSTPLGWLRKVTIQSTAAEWLYLGLPQPFFFLFPPNPDPG